MKKTCFLFSSFLAFCFYAPTAMGQVNYNYVGAAQKVLAQNQMQQNLDYNLHRMMNRTMANRSAALHNPKATFQVTLLDSTQILVKSKIMFDEKNRSYLEREDTRFKKTDPNRVQKIYPTDTRSIRKMDTYGGLMTPGMPADSCWLFKQVTGKINGYTFLPIEVGMDIGYFKFLQKGEAGPLQKIHKDSMLVMMQDNEKAVKLLKKEKAFDALVKYNQK